MYALVTGASSGIGKEIARLLAEKKWNLILVARREERLKDLAKELQTKNGIDVVVKPVDLSSIDNVKKLHEEVQVYKPEIVVNDAGFGKTGYFTSISLEDEQGMIDLNVKSLHAMTKLFVNSMDHGVILNVASMAAYLPTPLLATYSATKAFVLSLSESVNLELKKQKRPLSVLSLCPGPVDTEFAQVANSDAALKGISAEQCAQEAVRGIFRKKPRILPGFFMKLTRFFIRFTPTNLTLNVTYKIQSKKKAK